MTFIKINPFVDKNPSGREMFEKIQVAYELLLPIVEAGGKIQGSSEENGESDDVNCAAGLSAGFSGMVAIKLLMNTQIIICKRHHDEIGIYKYPAYDILLTCLELPSKTNTSNDDYCLLKSARADFIKIAVELTFQTCLVSPLNAEELVSLGGVASLASLLNFYLGCYSENATNISWGKAGIADNKLVLGLIMNIVRTISGVSYFEPGRKAIVELEDLPMLCVNWRRCLDGYYWDDNSPLITKYSLEGIANMSKDHTLQQMLVGSGVIWPLIRCLLSYDPTLESVSTEHDDQVNQMMTQATSNNHAKLATRALGMLCGVMTEEKLKSPYNHKVYVLLQNVLTHPISKMLRNQRPAELLKTLNTNVETPARIWNVGMRQELVDFISLMEKDRDTIGFRSFDDELESTKGFSYTALTNEVHIGGVYVRVFTSTGGGKAGLREIENCSTFAIGLLQYITRILNKYSGESILAVPNSHENNGFHTDICDISDKRFTMSIKALLLLVQVDNLIDDVLCDDDHCGPAILLSLLELPEESEAFALSSDILILLSPKQTFADAVARQGELWRLLQVLEQSQCDARQVGSNEVERDYVRNELDVKKDADQAIANASRQRRGWALLESLTSSTSIANALVRTSGWLELLGILVGFIKFTKLWSSRQGAAKTLARLLWDPTTGTTAAPMLQKFLPVALVSLLKEEGADALLNAFDSECETPELIWDGDMRAELRSAIAEQLEACLQLRECGKGGSLYSLPPGFQVKYKKLEDELYVGGVYVRLFLKEPTFSLHDPSAFLEMLMQSWTQELEILTSDRELTKTSSKTSIALAKQDKIELVTSAAIYLCKVRSPLNDKLAQWGYMSQSAVFIERSLLKQLIGAPLLSAIRILHVASTRRSNVEAMSKIGDTHGRGGIVMLIKRAISNNDSLHVDCGFMIECLKKIFINALGDVNKVILSEGAGSGRNYTNTVVLGDDTNFIQGPGMKSSSEEIPLSVTPPSLSSTPVQIYGVSSNINPQIAYSRTATEKQENQKGQYAPAYPHIQAYTNSNESADSSMNTNVTMSYQSGVNVLPAPMNPPLDPLRDNLMPSPPNNSSVEGINITAYQNTTSRLGPHQISHTQQQVPSRTESFHHPLDQNFLQTRTTNAPIAAPPSSYCVLQDPLIHPLTGNVSSSSNNVEPIPMIYPTTDNSGYDSKPISPLVSQSQPAHFTHIQQSSSIQNTPLANTGLNDSSSLYDNTMLSSLGTPTQNFGQTVYLQGNRNLSTNGMQDIHNEIANVTLQSNAHISYGSSQTQLPSYAPNPIMGSGIDIRSSLPDSIIAEQKSTTIPGSPGCAIGRVELLNGALNNELPRFLVENVLSSTSLKHVRDPAGVTAHTVELLKLLTKDPGYGMKFKIILDSLPGWKKYKSQDHSLYITSIEQKVDYFLTDGGTQGKKLLTDGEK